MEIGKQGHLEIGNGEMGNREIGKYGNKEIGKQENREIRKYGSR